MSDPVLQTGYICMAINLSEIFKWLLIIHVLQNVIWKLSRTRDHLQNETCPSHCGQAQGSQRQTASKVCTPSISVTDCRRHASKTRQQDKPVRQTWKTFLEDTPERQIWKTLVQDNPGRHSCKTLWEDALRRLSKNVRVTLLLTEAATFIFDFHPFSLQRKDWATAVSTSLQSWIRLCHCFHQRRWHFRW